MDKRLGFCRKNKKCKGCINIGDNSINLVCNLDKRSNYFGDVVSSYIYYRVTVFENGVFSKVTLESDIWRVLTRGVEFINE